MTDRLLSLLGLCRRAGKLILGADPVVESINKHKSSVVFYANDFSHNSIKPVLEAAHKNNVKAFEINRSKEQLSLALGKICGVVSVEDKGFADKLVGLTNEELGGELYGKIQG